MSCSHAGRLFSLLSFSALVQKSQPLLPGPCLPHGRGGSRSSSRQGLPPRHHEEHCIPACPAPINESKRLAKLSAPVVRPYEYDMSHIGPRRAPLPLPSRLFIRQGYPPICTAGAATAFYRNCFVELALSPLLLAARILVDCPRDTTPSIATHDVPFFSPSSITVRQSPRHKQTYSGSSARPRDTREGA